VIDASFGDGQFGDHVFSAWLALYGNARKSERLQQIVMLYHRRLHANLVYGLRQMVGNAAANRLAESIASMIDGLWLRYALLGPPASADIPRALTRRCLDGLLVQESCAPAQ
jgi:TetR/AcrR family transcriptional repressor of bet genes